jgi:LysM repeat protein
MIIQENQSLFDIAVQEDGSVLAVFEWALANGLSITDVLEPGQKLKAPKSSFRNGDLANYFKGRNQQVATCSTIGNDKLPIQPSGIGAMIIGTDFIIT